MFREADFYSIDLPKNDTEPIVCVSASIIGVGVNVTDFSLFVEFTLFGIVCER